MDYGTLLIFLNQTNGIKSWKKQNDALIVAKKSWL